MFRYNVMDAQNMNTKLCIVTWFLNTLKKKVCYVFKDMITFTIMEIVKFFFKNIIYFKIILVFTM
jgi:hypothetical protein